MSTPIHQLPSANQPAAGKVPSMDDDPVVSDVIQEMTREMHQPQIPVPTVALNMQGPTPQMHISPPQVQGVYHNTMQPQYAMQQHNVPYPHRQSFLEKHFDFSAAQRAAIVAVMVFVVFYPSDLTSFYERIPGLARFAQYDRIIRIVLLVVVLYVAFWKFQI